MLICPKCRKPLILKDRSFCCEDRHSYDLAKSGYVNLVLGNTKTSGDSKEMVKARSEFLNAWILSAFIFTFERTAAGISCSYFSRCWMRGGVLHSAISCI